MRHQRTVGVGVVVAMVMLLWGTARVMAAGELITLLQEVTVPGNCLFFDSAPVSTQNAQQVSLLGRAQGHTGVVEIQLVFTADAEQGTGPRLRSFGAACDMTENGIETCPKAAITSASPAVHSIGGPFMFVRILNCEAPAIITLKAFLIK